MLPKINKGYLPRSLKNPFFTPKKKPLPSYTEEEFKVLSRIIKETCDQESINGPDSLLYFMAPNLIKRLFQIEPWREQPFLLPYKKIPLHTGNPFPKALRGHPSTIHTDYDYWVQEWTEAVLKWRLQIGK